MRLTYRNLDINDGHDGLYISVILYGWRKLYNAGIPLRPIVNLSTYSISSYLAKVLSANIVAGNSEYTVSNSLEFAEFITGNTLNTQHELVFLRLLKVAAKSWAGMLVDHSDVWGLMKL